MQKKRNYKRTNRYLKGDKRKGKLFWIFVILFVISLVIFNSNSNIFSGSTLVSSKAIEHQQKIQDLVHLPITGKAVIEGEIIQVTETIQLKKNHSSH